MWALYWIPCGDEDAEPEGKALDLPVDLRSKTHLRLLVFGKDWKNEPSATSG